MIGNGVGRAAHGNLMTDDIEHAAALQAGRRPFVEEAHRHIDGHLRILAEPQEIDMDGKVADGIELDGAGDHPRLLALDVEHVDRALKMAGVKLLVDHAVIDRDPLGPLLVAVKDTGNAPLATFRARSALARTASRPSLEFDRLSHRQPPTSQNDEGPESGPARSNMRHPAPQHGNRGGL
jgi:hypothetical protein